MSYGLKYQMTFSDLKSNTCRFDISQKDYTAYDPIVLKGTEVPVLLDYDAGDEDVLKPIRGCSVSLQYINEADTRTRLAVDYQEFIDDVYSLFLTGIPTAGDVVNILLYQFMSTHSYTFTVLDNMEAQDVIDAVIDIINATALFTAIPLTDGLAITAVSGNNFIAPTGATVNLIPTNGGVPLKSFFSEDDTEFLGEFYINDQLRFKGFLIQDDCSQPFQSAPFPVELKFNDGLGLLSEHKLNDTILNTGIASKESVASFIYALLQKTGLDMPLEIYNNVFEERMLDRNDDPANDPFVQAYLKTASFKDENSYKDCFTVLEELLKAADCVLFQADGSWCVMRWPELARFNNNMPGSVLELDVLTTSVVWAASFDGLGGSFQFSGNSEAYRFSVGGSFSITDATDARLNGVYNVSYIITDGGTGSDLVVTVYEQPTEALLTETITGTFKSSRSGFTTTVADAIAAVNVAANGDLVPIEFSQTESVKRGFRYVQRTFDVTPTPLIQNDNLTELGRLISSFVDGDFTYSDYELIGWSGQQSQTAYIRVKVETATTKEKDRYIVIEYNGTQSVSQLPSAAIITPKIDIGLKDRWNFRVSYRASEDFNDNEHFGVALFLRSCDGGSLKVLTATNNTDASKDRAFWSTYIPFTPFDPGVSIPTKSLQRFPSTDKTEWATFDAATVYDPNNFGLPAFPFDGTLEIGIYGKNNWNGINDATQDTYIKDIKLGYFYSITDSTEINGQIHTATGNAMIKNILEESVSMDDTIRLDGLTKQNIRGSIYLDDSESCAVLAYNWKTSSDNTPLYRFGQIQSIDRLGINQMTRRRIEGTFYMNALMSMKNIIQFGYGELSASTFLISRASFDFRNNKLGATFDEAWNTEDADATDLAAFAYAFKYKFKDNL